MPMSKPKLLEYHSSKPHNHEVQPPPATRFVNWKSVSLAAASEADPNSSTTRSDDANILLVLLCFFSPGDKICLDFLLRGGAKRERWSKRGGIEVVDAIQAGLVPELSALLTDIVRLTKAFHELEHAGWVFHNQDETYSIDESTIIRIHDNLPSEIGPFWRLQSLVVAYRSIPWKYIEPPISNARAWYLPHLIHTLLSCRDDIDLLKMKTKADLALSLVEASRLADIKSRRLIISEAKAVAHGINDPYLHSSIALGESAQSRIAGDVDMAVVAVQSSVQDVRGDEGIADPRMHSAAGQTAIQDALNSMQSDDLVTAEKALLDWMPLSENSSTMEQVTLFRKNMVLGRLYRYRGSFNKSRLHLERARNFVTDRADLNFDEDRRDLYCDLADTLRELNDPGSAERHLRAEIARREQTRSVFGSRSLLDLSLAEALFAQDRFEESERICKTILRTRPNLLRIEQLRLYITLAKLCHTAYDYEGALSHWKSAMGVMGRFRPSNAPTTRILVLSVCDILDRLGRTSLAGEYLKQLHSLGEQRPGGVEYWIAGLRHWMEYLQAQEGSRRSRL